MSINNPLEIKKPQDYDLFVDYCKGNAVKPDSNQSQKILNGLLNNIKTENNIYHKDVTDAMFRQVYSTATLPSKSNTISVNTIIKAVDYDLGRNGFAYADKDTASYMYTPGIHTQGNRGRTYRNDGVDIKNDENKDSYVFTIEDGEWLLYTLIVEKAANYYLTFNTSGTNGMINVYNGNKIISENINVQASEDSGKQVTSSPVIVHLDKGINKVKIYFVKGGFNFKNFQLKLKE